MITAAGETDAWARRRQSDAPPFEFVVQNERPFDPSTEPERGRGAIARLQDAGATMINVRFVHHSVDHYCDQLAAMAGVVAEL